LPIAIKTRQTCRTCKGRLETILDLGEQYIVSFGDKPLEKAPLELTKCDKCHLVQLRHTVDPEFLFRHYYYASGTNQTMRDHLKGIVQDVTKRVTLKEDDTVIDIGANDCTLLSYYPSEVKKIGYEPADIVPIRGIDKLQVFRDFFNNKIWGSWGIPETKIITAISMFYDLDNPNAFLQDIKRVLTPDGLFVIQQNYLPAMLENNAVDNIVHEHLCYYSLYTLDKLLIKNGFAITDYSFNDLNGGSFRVYVRHSDKSQLADFPEEGNKLHTLAPYQEFRDRVGEIAYRLQTFVPTEKFKGKTTYVYGASTRGAVILQLARLLDPTLIPFAVERNPAKFGTLYLGKIPVISEEQARKNPPDYYLVLPWHFKTEILEREEVFLRSGGKMIFPLPWPTIEPSGEAL